MRRIYTVVGLLLFAFIATVEAQTQNYYNTQTGVPPGTMQYPVPGGVANLDTGNLFLKFPLASIPQRSGRPVTLSLVYNSNFWANVDFLPPATAAWYYPVNNGGLNLTIDWGAYPFAQHDTTQDPSQCPLGGIAEIYNDYRTVDSNGTEVNFGNLQTTQYKCLNGSGGYNPVFGTKSAAGWSVGNEGYYLSIDNYGQSYQLWAPDGTMTTFPSGTQNDSNGNVLGNTFDAQSNWIDQLGRKNDILYGSASTPCPTIDQNMGGTTPSDSCSVVVQTDDGPATYTWTYEQIPVCSANSNNIPTGSYCGNINVPYTLTLPGTGAQYKFSYDQGTTPGHYGTLTGITLPTGATLTYSYLPNTLPVNGYITGLLVPHSASDGFGTTTFSFSSSGYNNLSVNVTTPATDLATYTTTLSTTAPYTYTKVLSQYSGTTSLLKTTTTVTDTALHPQSVTTAWHTSGKSATTTYQYQPNTWLLSLKQEGDFTGAIVRTTKIDYLKDTGSIPYVSQDHIVNRPQQVQVFAGASSSGTPLSQTIYTYDEYSAGYCKNGVSGLTDHTSAVGHLTSYGTSYTARGNATTASHLISGSTYATTHTCYDTLGTVTQTVDANGNPTTFDNTDSWANGGSSSCAIGADTYAYPTTITNALGQQQKLSYSSCSGQLTVSKDPNDIAAGRSGTTYQYAEPRERLTSVSHPDGGETTTTYNDSAVTQTDTTLVQTSPAEYTTVTTMFDGLGRVKQTETTDPQGPDYVDTTYDPMGRIQSVSNPHRTYSAPTDGITSYAYDALSRRTLQCNQDNGTTTTCTPGSSYRQWNYTDNTVDVYDEAKNRWQQTVDALGRLTTVLEPDSSNSPTIETDYTYDALDNLTRVDQYGGAKGNSAYTDLVRTFTYDGLSRLWCAQNPETNPGNPTCPASVGATAPQGSTSYSYDPNGNIKNRTDGRGVVTNYGYDALNRITSKTYQTPLPQWVAPTSNVSYTYDVAIAGWGWTPQSSPSWPNVSQTNLIGRLSDVSVNSIPYAWTVYGYDPMGRIVLKSECLPIDCGNNHHDMHYKYDLAGNLTFYDRGLDIAANSRTPNQGYYYGGFTEQYDTAGNLSSVTGDTAGTNTATNIWSTTDYFPTGQPYTALALGAYNLKFSVSSRNWVTGQLVTNTGQQTIWQSSASHNTNGTVSTTTDTYAGGWTFTYDHMNRVATANSPGGNLAYTIDPFGNKTKQAITWGTAPATTFNSVAANNALSGNNLQYEFNLTMGNVTADGYHTYGYDAEGRLFTVGNTACFVYDGDGDRVATTNCNVVWTSPGQVTGILAEYLYDFNHRLMTQIDPTTGKAVRANIYAGNNYLAEDAADANLTNSPTATQLRLTDQVGSVRGLVDLSGNIPQKCTAFPYGDQLTCKTGQTTVPSATGPGLFTGKDRDSQSDLDYFGARYYNSTMGRFMSPDQNMGSMHLSNPQSLNRYAYVLNNPLSFVDPDGLDCVYLNSSGTGVSGIGSDGGSVDHNSNFNECVGTDANGNPNGSNGGYWVDGTVNASDVNANPDTGQVTVGNAAVYSVQGGAFVTSGFGNTVTVNGTAPTIPDTSLINSTAVMIGTPGTTMPQLRLPALPQVRAIGQPARYRNSVTACVAGPSATMNTANAMRMMRNQPSDDSAGGGGGSAIWQNTQRGDKAYGSASADAKFNGFALFSDYFVAVGQCLDQH
jgi:RHS repeat-associated protein